MSGYLKQGEEKGDSIFTKATNGILRVGTQGMKGREREGRVVRKVKAMYIYKR